MNEIVIGGTFNHEISNKAYEIIKLVKSHTDFKINFDYTDEETPYCQKIENKYVIHIRKDTDDIEDVILHELMHVVQSENGMTKTEIPNDISDRDYELLSDLEIYYLIMMQINNCLISTIIILHQATYSLTSGTH